MVCNRNTTLYRVKMFELCNDPSGWGPIEHGDFTPCFQGFFINPVASAYMVIIGLMYLPTLVRIPRENGYQVVVFREPLRFLCSLFLVITSILMIVLTVLSHPDYYHVYFYSGLDIIAWFLSMGLTYMENVRCVDNSWPTRLYWILYAIIMFKRVESAILYLLDHPLTEAELITIAQSLPTVIILDFALRPRPITNLRYTGLNGGRDVWNWSKPGDLQSFNRSPEQRNSVVSMHQPAVDDVWEKAHSFGKLHNDHHERLLVSNFSEPVANLSATRLTVSSHMEITQV